MPKRSSSSVKIFYPRWTRAQVLALLRQRLPRLNERLPLARVVLFGSYARGNYTVASDIDLLVVYKGHPREDAYRLVKQVLAIPGLEPHTYSEREYCRVAQVVEKMTEDGIPLWPENRDA